MKIKKSTLAEEIVKRAVDGSKLQSPEYFKKKPDYYDYITRGKDNATAAVYEPDER